jgi:hypothetical protein
MDRKVAFGIWLLLWVFLCPQLGQQLETLTLAWGVGLWFRFFSITGKVPTRGPGSLLGKQDLELLQLCREHFGPWQALSLWLFPHPYMAGAEALKT